MRKLVILLSTFFLLGCDTFSQFRSKELLGDKNSANQMSFQEKTIDNISIEGSVTRLNFMINAGLTIKNKNDINYYFNPTKVMMKSLVNGEKIFPERISTNKKKPWVTRVIKDKVYKLPPQSETFVNLEYNGGKLMGATHLSSHPKLSRVQLVIPIEKNIKEKFFFEFDLLNEQELKNAMKK